MLSNLGNILLFLNVILSLSIIYAANRNLKLSGGVGKIIFQLSLIQSTSIIISFSGTVPNLFSEEKGVVAEGKLQDKTFFVADRILAKHDENYMPPELKDLMKKNAE